MQDEEKRKRSKNFSPIEASAFIELLTSARVRLIEDKSSNGPIVKKKNECWDTVCHEFNALGFGIRTVAQLKEYWKRKKKELKKVLAEKKREVRGTGGGPSEITLAPFLQRMSDLIPRAYLEAPSELQNPYDSDYGIHAPMVTTDEQIEHAADDTFDGSFLSYLEQSDADKNCVSEMSASTAALIGPENEDTDNNIKADCSLWKTNEPTSSEEATNAQGASLYKMPSTRPPAKSTPSGSLGRVNRRQPMNEFQIRLLQMAEEEHTLRMEILCLKRSYWKKKVTIDPSC